MPGLVPGIHALVAWKERRGWPGQARPWRNVETEAISLCCTSASLPCASRMACLRMAGLCFRARAPS